MPVLLAGDTHGDTHHAHILVSKAKVNDCDVILQLGDFGYFFSGEDKLDDLNHLLKDNGVEMWFLDGNHENFDLLSAMGASPDDDEATYIKSNVRYLPRGYVFDLCGWKLMSFGGAFSIDKDWRSPHISWWPEELITEAQVRKVEDSPTKVDILVSHDVPEVPQYLSDNLLWRSLGYKIDAISQSNREMLRRVFDAVHPDYVFHGHYHYRYSDRMDGALINGLGMNGDTKNTYVLYDKEAE